MSELYYLFLITVTFGLAVVAATAIVAVICAAVAAPVILVYCLIAKLWAQRGGAS